MPSSFKVQPWHRCLFWNLLALVVLVWQGPSFVEDLRPHRTRILDFFQEWASARNRLEGLPVYTNQQITAVRYLGFVPVPNDPFFAIHFNAHPPPSVLLALPFIPLDYPDAFLAWSLLSLAEFGLSLWIIARQFALRLSVWWVLPLLALLLLCGPFRQQMIQGQLNLILLLLLTGAWAADRSGHSGWAGALLGAAAAIKLFPAFLFLWFLARRQWWPLVTGALVFALLTGLTVLILGPQTYYDYITVALPSLGRYRVSWFNVSLAGFWNKLFNPAGSNILPLWQNATLAWSATLASDVVVTGLAVWCAWRSRLQAQADLAFGAVVAAMLLVSPLAWDHYFVLLAPTLLFLWSRLPASGPPRLLFWGFVAALWQSPLLYWSLAVPGATFRNWPTLVVTPAQSLTGLSMQMYILLAFFVYLVVLSLRTGSDSAAGARLTAAHLSLGGTSSGIRGPGGPVTSWTR